LHRLKGLSGSALMVDLQTSEVAPDFGRGDADGDIRYLSNQILLQADPGVRRVKLAAPLVFPVASPDIARRLAETLYSAHDLLQAPLIEERDAAEWTSWFVVQGIKNPSISRVARYAHANLAIAAARAGQGVALANPFLVNEDLAAGRLVKLEPQGCPFADAVLGAYIFRSGNARWNDPTVTYFRRWLLREFNFNAPYISS
jgi:LysR family transcriptional regulator, glycine cleavage system transcriptional activator